MAFWQKWGWGKAKTARAQSFEGARMARRLASWRVGSDGINAAIRQGGDVLRARSRDLVRNNPYANNATTSFAAHAIGAGIKPSSLIEDADLKDRIQRLWLAWTDEADADGLTDFYGLQSIAARTVFEAGECFFRLRPRRPKDGLVVPLQLQILPSEQLPFAHSETLPNGNEVIFGIEFDRLGRRVAYHFLRQPPGDVRQNADHSRVRVPANQVLHIFNPVAEGQIRGVPWLTPAMTRLWLLEQYDDAELDRKKVAAMFAAFVTKPSPEEMMGEDGATKDQDNAALIGLEPGTLQMLLPGEDIKFSDPADVGGSYEAFQYRTLLACCSAMGVPYTNVTGDLRQANYSSLREGKLEFRRRMWQFQHNVMIFQMCRPVWRRWMEDAVLSGALDIGDYAQMPGRYLPAKWIPPKWDWVDPLKDRKAEIEAINAGLKSRSDVIESEGYDAEEVDRRIAADRAREEALGLKFENDGDALPTLPPEDEDATPEQSASVA
ncbi:phage portal protein [Thalassospira sp.]|uniref:phage portal protein n=1 Tax=Thalassospira sp. TaxID=1912094 RepID=UPI001B182C22|nr:phage portal protein [Thalassospira sp.]MBO6522122.1 phage portal protein [Rhodospirillales bacterium]MBO6773764.1 phage portal protein [Thalassospira sp.]